MGEPSNMTRVVAEDNSKDFVAAASSCDSGCKKACKKIDQHCCSKDGNDCLCQLPQFSCASEPSNMTRVKVVAEDNSKDFVAAASSCDSGCKKACKKIDQHCCSKDGNDC